MGLGRRALFAAVVAVGVALFVELAAFVAYGIAVGETFRFASSRAAQAEIAGEAVEAVDPEAPRRLTPLDAQVVHPYLGFVFDPGAPLADAPRDPTLPRVVSAWGFNDDAPPLRTRSDDRVIVGVVGGSVARLFARKAHRLLAEALADAPTFAGRAFEFIVLAVDGHKQPQQLMAVSWILSLGGEFDLILNLDGFNEVALDPLENARHGVFPSYPRTWFARADALPDPDVQATRGRISYLRHFRRRLAQAALDPPARYSVTANLLWRVVDTGIDRELFRANERLARPGAVDREFRVTGPPGPAPDAREEALTGIWRDSSLQLDRLARANGILYFHFLQPNQYVPASKEMGAAEREAAWDGDHPYRAGVEEGYPLLIREGEALAASGVRFRDLTAIFRGVPKATYSDACCHLTNLGNRILAREVAAFIRERLDAETGT